MSWLFSQALVAEYSAATCWDGAPSAPLSVMHTQHKFWRNDKTMETSQLSRFGLTCAALTEDRGEDLLMWFRADSRVRTYQLPGLELGLKVLDRGSGSKWLESSVRFDRASSSWRTHQCLWEEDLPWSSVTLPRWGTTLSGLVYRHRIQERPINATESGLWPTPTVHGNHNRPGSSKTAGWGLSSAVKLWPTPTAMNSSGGAALSKWGGSNARAKLKTMVTPEELHGPLNPQWVEWLMGWPIGWTDLKPLEMAKFREWQRQHSPSFQATDAA